MPQNKLLPLLAIAATSSADAIKPNLLPGLVPPPGEMWRGSTICMEGILESDWANGADP